MSPETVLAAKAEAERFVDRVNRLLHVAASVPGELMVQEHARESGAVKRASMDLTRALTVMRRPGDGGR